MPYGEHTARVARALRQALSDRDVGVLFDHGEQGIDPPECLGEIVSWYGDEYGRDTRLALLDIAVVWRDGDRAAALIEIEESSATPKVVLGDLTAALLGDRVTFQGERGLEVGAWTTLIVLVPAKSEGKRQQVAELARRIEAIQVRLRSGNAAIGRVRVGTYGEASELEQVVEGLVREALGDGPCSSACGGRGFPRSSVGAEAETLRVLPASRRSKRHVWYATCPAEQGVI